MIKEKKSFFGYWTSAVLLIVLGMLITTWFPTPPDTKYISNMNEFADYWCKTQTYEEIVTRGYYDTNICVENGTRTYTWFDIRFFDKRTNRTVFKETIQYIRESTINHTWFYTNIEGRFINNEDAANTKLKDYLFDVIYEYSIFDYEITTENTTGEYCDEYLWIDAVAENRSFDSGVYEAEHDHEILSATYAFHCIK